MLFKMSLRFLSYFYYSPNLIVFNPEIVSYRLSSQGKSSSKNSSKC